MSGCTNPQLGRLLHDFELELLSPEDRHRFELHLYDCAHCLHQAREFMSVSRILKYDPDAHAIVKDLAGESDDVKQGRSRKQFSPFTKLLIAAVIVVVLAIPAYRYWLQPDQTAVRQTLELLPARAGGSDVIYLEKGGDVEISFYVAEYFQGRVDLIISSIAGDTLINTPGFSDFNDNGLGSITLPISMFSDSHYLLNIKPDPETGVEGRIYMFRVK